MTDHPPLHEPRTLPSRPFLRLLALAACQLKPRPLRLLVIIAGYAGDVGGSCWAGRQRLADDLGWPDPDVVTKAARQLEAAGFLAPVGRQKWILRDPQSFPQSRVVSNRPALHNEPASNGPAVSNDDDPAMKRLTSNFPIVAGFLIQAVARVAAFQGEEASAAQTAAFRKVIEKWLRKHPASQPVLESADWWADLVQQSDWGTSSGGSGKLGYGKRMAWVFENRLRSALPTMTAEERQEEVQKISDVAKATGHNPFL